MVTPVDSSPNDKYPEIYSCKMDDPPLTMPNDESLEIRTWLAHLSNEGDTLKLEAVGGWAAVILWNGSASIKREQATLPVESCNSGLAHIGWLSLEAKDTIVAGEAGTRIIVVSLATPEGAPRFYGEVLEGSTQELKSEHGDVPLVPLLRVLRTLTNRASYQVSWPRGSVAITSLVGPQVLPDTLPRVDQDDLIFLGLLKATDISFIPGENLDALAVVIDFQISSDDDPIAIPPVGEDGPEGGCSWRCKG